MITLRPSPVPMIVVSAVCRSFQKSASLRVCTRELSAEFEASCPGCPGVEVVGAGVDAPLEPPLLPPGFTTLGELEVTRVSVTP